MCTVYGLEIINNPFGTLEPAFKYPCKIEIVKCVHGKRRLN